MRAIFQKFIKKIYGIFEIYFFLVKPTSKMSAAPDASASTPAPAPAASTSRPHAPR
jgi:hypothetical protein